jgi:hypothetical protein
MALNQHAANLVDITVNAFNGDSSSIAEMDGISLVNSWITTLRSGDYNTMAVANGLSALRDELQSGNPNGWHVRGILENLVNLVKQMATSEESDVKTKLVPLVDALEEFSHQLGGSAKPAYTGGNRVVNMDDTTGSNGDVHSPLIQGDDYSPGTGTYSSGVSSERDSGHIGRSGSGSSETYSGPSRGRSQY